MIIFKGIKAMHKDGYDYLAKLLIIGDSGVGKTNILLRFCQNNFVPSHLTTIGIDFKIKTIEIDDKKIRLQIWDTAGQERFKTITQTYYKGAMGILMTYAVNDRSSFNSLQHWLKQIKCHAAQRVIIALVANKIDCHQRQVSTEEGKQLAETFGVNYFEVSAKENINIVDMFKSITREIMDRILSGDINDFISRRQIIKNKNDNEKPLKKRCC